MAITVDSTARSYDMSALDIGNDGAPPDGPSDRSRFVNLWLQADTNDVFIHFRPDAGAADLDNTQAIAAGAALVYVNSHGAVIKAGNPPIYLRIQRNVDRFMVLKAASTGGFLRIWAASSDSS